MAPTGDLESEQGVQKEFALLQKVLAELQHGQDELCAALCRDNCEVATQIAKSVHNLSEAFKFHLSTGCLQDSSEALPHLASGVEPSVTRQATPEDEHGTDNANVSSSLTLKQTAHMQDRGAVSELLVCVTDGLSQVARRVAAPILTPADSAQLERVKVMTSGTALVLACFAVIWTMIFLLHPHYVGMRWTAVPFGTCTFMAVACYVGLLLGVEVHIVTPILLLQSMCCVMTAMYLQSMVFSSMGNAAALMVMISMSCDLPTAFIATCFGIFSVLIIFLCAAKSWSWCVWLTVLFC